MIQKIIIIDDDDISLYLSSMILEEADFAAEIETYTSVDEALPHLDFRKGAMPAQEVVLLDLNMPVKSGWDFLDMLQPYAQKLKDRLHIFILTSSIANSDKSRSHSYPLVRGFLHKPLDDKSLHLIHNVLATANR